MIKAGEREFKCHKVILYNSGSDYFKTLLSPDSKFAESQQPVIELKDDDPKAVEAMLGFLYGHEYSDFARSARQPQNLLWFNMDVFVTAQKYLLPGLQREAIYALRAQGDDAQESFQRDSSILPLFELIQALTVYQRYDEVFLEYGKELIEDHLLALMSLKPFREWMDIDGTYAVPLVLDAVAAGSDAHKIITCRGCGRVRPDGEILDRTHIDDYALNTKCPGDKGVRLTEISFSGREVEIHDCGLRG